MSQLISGIPPPRGKDQRFLLGLLSVWGRAISMSQLTRLIDYSQRELGVDHYLPINFKGNVSSLLLEANIAKLRNRGWLCPEGSDVMLNTEYQLDEKKFKEDLAKVIDNFKKRRPRKTTSTSESSPRDAVKRATEHGILFTIGYEGIHIDEYIEKLLLAEVELLCDVRKNPISRKYGFSKNQLQNSLGRFEIAYRHFPELGINSELRRDLKSSLDYNKLFSKYKTSLSQQEKTLDQIADLLNKYSAIALTCFEMNYRSCHRHCVSDFLGKKYSQIEVRHL